MQTPCQNYAKTYENQGICVFQSFSMVTAEGNSATELCRTSVATLPPSFAPKGAAMSLSHNLSHSHPRPDSHPCTACLL